MTKQKQRVLCGEFEEVLAGNHYSDFQGPLVTSHSLHDVTKHSV